MPISQWIRNPKSLEKLIWGLFVVQFLPALLLYNQAYVRIHDTLEGELVWYALLAKHHLLLDFSPDAVVPEVMNGLTRYAFHSGLSFTALWIWLFGSYWGYLFNAFLLHLMAFVGMNTLLRDHFSRPNEGARVSALGAALCFSWVPFFGVFGATVAGQPWVLWAFLNILKNKRKWGSFAILCAIPFYSSLVWAAPAMLLLTGCAWLYFYLKDRKWRLLSIMGMGAMSVFYVVANYPLFVLRYFRPDFVSHRKDYDYFFDQTLTIPHSLTEAIGAFAMAHYHVGTLVAIPTLAFWFMARKYRPGFLTGFGKMLLWGIVSLCLFYGFYPFLVAAFGNALPLLAEFKFNRVIILLPFLWMLLLGVSLMKANPTRHYFAMAFLVAQFLLNVFANDEFLHNVRQLIGQPRKPNYHAFFAKSTFDQIDAHIGQPKNAYRVASLGLNPTVAQMNGFYTLDGLQAIYDLRHKHAFREIMAGELAKNDTLRQYFDAWGNRCYLFSAELGKRDRDFLISKYQQPKSIEHFAFDPEAFRRLGGKFLFSTVEIKNCASIGLTPDGVFEGEDGWWRIYLYRI